MNYADNWHAHSLKYKLTAKNVIFRIQKASKCKNPSKSTLRKFDLKNILIPLYMSERKKKEQTTHLTAKLTIYSLNVVVGLKLKTLRL